MKPPSTPGRANNWWFQRRIFRTRSAGYTSFVNHGVIPAFYTPLPVQSTPPKNHKSWTEAFPLLIRDITKGQLRGEYLILEGGLLPLLMQSKQIFLGPFGGAPKDGKPLTECARIFHDESFPWNHGMSLNAATTNIPLEITHDSVKQIARWGLVEARRCPDDVAVSVVQMRETMGLLRYFGTCIPVARPFNNRLQALLGVLEKVARPLKLYQTQAGDIRWLLSLF